MTYNHNSRFRLYEVPEKSVTKPINILAIFLKETSENFLIIFTQSISANISNMRIEKRNKIITNQIIKLCGSPGFNP